ncbi:magnesium transporter [Thalassospira alkalitolerans]|uniref:Magnesium transporter MgtE n=1 Tax=Thalassospira alkalitolerans TaxID=1293890 RepID=A0A1Y2L8X3_9PROT|nr:magnesium transporter [Thalassospira alkalitolerans]OSQ46837.1 magnesium transporter [Thalassospira alkalitolerans]|tara:strand:- start:30196 stop:31602 length:1407 start_codon:yes stop_codon:yes gene_type:complete
MTDQVEELERPAENASSGDEYVDLTPEYAREIIDALGDDDFARADELISELHFADIADLLGWASSNQRAKLVELIRPDFDPELLTELDDDLREEVISLLGTEAVAEAISELDSDDVVEVVEYLEAEDQKEILGGLSDIERARVEEALSYPEYTAGRIMQRELVAIPDYWSVGQTIDFLRSAKNLPDDFYDIIVVDPRYSPVGIVPLSRAIRTNRPVLIRDVMDAENMRTVAVTEEQENVAHLFRQRDLISAPVVDDSGRLVGVITVDDVVDVIDEEYEEDMMRLAGVGEEDDLSSAIFDTTRSRFTWLLVNLGTAIAASMVIGAFEGTIQQLVALAVLMPIVASMGGNAGTQTLTVAVRAIATRELTSTNAWRVVRKEVAVCGLNGVAFAVLAGGVTWFWFGDVLLGSVIGIAMVINLLFAGFFGALIPLGLERAGIDPAVSSAVFLTTITDVVGFFAFLGLAAVILL